MKSISSGQAVEWTDRLIKIVWIASNNKNYLTIFFFSNIYYKIALDHGDHPAILVLDVVTNINKINQTTNQMILLKNQFQKIQNTKLKRVLEKTTRYQKILLGCFQSPNDKKLIVSFIVSQILDFLINYFKVKGFTIKK